MQPKPDERNGIRIFGSLVTEAAAAKYDGWNYEDEVRIYPTRVESDEETGLYYVLFGEVLRLKEVIAGPRCHVSRMSIENALTGYSEQVKVVKARRADNGFEIILDVKGFPPQQESPPPQW